MLSNDLAALGGLALSAFLAATLLPGGSEAVFAGLLVLRPELGLAAVLTATVANTAGGMSTWLLGRLLPRKESTPRLALVQRWGSVALLLSWVPVIGDARTEARTRTADLGGNALLISKCIELQQTPGCQASITCYGQALKVAEPK